MISKPDVLTWSNSRGQTALTSHDLAELKAALAGLSQLYPELRFGQLMEMIAVLASEEAPEKPGDIDDDRLIQAARTHLSRHLE